MYKSWELACLWIRIFSIFCRVWNDCTRDTHNSFSALNLMEPSYQRWGKVQNTAGACTAHGLNNCSPGKKLYFETIKIINMGIILFSINLYVLR